MAKSKRSWSKEDNILGLIASKKVDWSVFQYGTHIPVDFHEDFEEANNGELPGRGSSKPLKLIIDGNIYEANIKNVSRQGVDTEVLEINYDSNAELKQLMVDKFSTSYDYLKEEREKRQQNGDGKITTVPDDIAEYIDFYKTKLPYQYRLEFRNSSMLQDLIEQILSEYIPAREQDAFGKTHPMWSIFTKLQNLIQSSYLTNKYPNVKVKWSIGQGNWAKVPWIALLDQRETSTTQKSVYCVFLFRQDMSGVYLTFNQGVTEPKDQLGAARGREHLRKQARNLRERYSELSSAGYILDNNIDLRVKSGLGVDYEASTIAYKFYEASSVATDNEIYNDLDTLLRVYENYVSKGSGNEEDGKVSEVNFIFADGLNKLITDISSRGYVYEPWQIASYVVALRTKPFVILAGVSGTGKSKLPALVSEATGGEVQLVSVRPDWTDSSDILGYTNLQGDFLPGPLLEIAKEAWENQHKHYVCIIDEMNLARVEHYFAEVLSRIEDRRSAPEGGYNSGPLLVQKLEDKNEIWSTIGLPPNLVLVGTVNMDESTHGFSRKVLDRAFTIELSEVDLTVWNLINRFNEEQRNWPVNAWYPRAIRLGELGTLSEAEHQQINAIIKELVVVNRFLKQTHCQVGYRTRDEIVLFVLHANDVLSSFVNHSEEQVDPLDLALQMKILPRISGGSNTVRHTLLQLLGWTYKKQPFRYEEDASAVIDQWEADGQPPTLATAQYPRTAARLCLMWNRMINEGFTSYWL
ncbi:MAG: DUF3578 domain-containing protein [Firmicutes bacterium]|nr:DUF3578 domain-containing protein [Bacillota bacterium]